MKKTEGPKAVLIGIDPGVKTGLAMRVDGVMDTLQTTSILGAMDYIMTIIATYHPHKEIIHVRCEDARLRTWYGSSGREVLQGVGSVKRDCTIWEEFLRQEGLDYEMVHPKNNSTKIPAALFNKLAGWTGRSSEHSRDAGMLIT